MTLLSRFKRGHLTKNKKGTILDVLVVLVVIGFVVAVAGLITFRFYDDLYDGLYNELPNNVSQAALDTVADMPAIFDYIFLAVIMGLIITGYIFAFLTRESPIFLFINVIIAMVLVIISVVMANAYDALVTDPALNATAAQFPIQSFVWDHMPLLVTVAVFGMFIVMYIVGGKDGGF